MTKYSIKKPCIPFMLKKTHKQKNPLKGTLQACLLILLADSFLMREKRIEMFAFEDFTSFTFLSILHLILIYDFRG